MPESLVESPAGSLPEKLMPADPVPEWAWLLRRRLREPEPVPYASIPDLLWLTEQPLEGTGARSPGGGTG